MPCTPISVALDVEPPSQTTEVIFQLDKICNDDDTVEWKLHFQLKKKSASGDLAPVVTVDVDINKEDHAKAAATAKHGMDDNQLAQADATGQAAMKKDRGELSQGDVEDQASQIIPVRDPNSPS
jgi:hypothetical protein